VLDGLRSVTLPMAIKRVPELARYYLVHRFVTHWLTLYFELAVVGAGFAISRRRLVPLLLVLPWMKCCLSLVSRDRWPPTRWPKGLAKLAFFHARHGLMVASLLIGSVRARRLLV
jgi:hypothetical protein